MLIDLQLPKAGIENVLKAFRKQRDVDPLIQTISRRLLRQFKDGFRQSSAPDGQAWAPIHHRQGKPLVDTGRLRRSLKASIQGNKIIISSDSDYAATHQLGRKGSVTISAHKRLMTQAFGKPLSKPVYANIGAYQQQQNITARPFLDCSKRQHKLIKRAFKEWKQGKLK